MNKMLLVLGLALACCIDSEAKKHAKEEPLEISTVSNEDIKAKLAGQTFFGTQREHWRGHGSFFEQQPLTTVNVNVTMEFNSAFNTVLVRVETVPVGVNNPEKFGLGDTYTKTYTYKIVDGELVIGSFAHYKISENGNVLTAKGNVGNAYPLRLVKR